MTVNGDRKKSRTWKILALVVLVLVSWAIGRYAFRSETKPAEQETSQTELPVPAVPAAAVPDASQEAPATAPADANREDKAADETSAPPKTSRPALAGGDKKTERVDTPVPSAPASTATVRSAPPAAPNGTQFRWKHVGGDPCNPKAGCTLEWALEQMGWPTSVQNALLDKVTHEVSQVYTMKSGWIGSMTWGRHTKKFEANTLADWPLGHTEIASLWQVTEGNQIYNLVKVSRCGNWGGWTETGSVPPPVKNNRMPLSVLPTGSCIPVSDSIASQ